ncbi:hypothetical protein IMCC26134_02100 [Verrucomicrobia bacterium IMCC26134]|nr:hypothetical protein IMCC26134_02100 [Verrucomicrobia bacterium IMCC26134]
MPSYVNDGSADSPKLLAYINLANLDDLRPDSLWPGLTGAARDKRLDADGFQGVQCVDSSPAPGGTSLRHCGSDRVNLPAEADPVIARHAALGHDCVTLHVGWGLEDDAEIDFLVDAILRASQRHSLPVFIETHRATITQDLWRTVQLTKRFPDVRFNGDFSHFYTGQELAYGDMPTKLAFMAPIFERVAFMHGRIGSSGCMQVSIGDGQGRPPAAHGVVNFLDDFKSLWTHAMLGFLRNAGRGDCLVFCPELLSGAYYYARRFPNGTGGFIEESDRYREALVYNDIARACFAEAKKRHASD